MALTKATHERIEAARKAEPFATHKRIARISGHSVAESKAYSRWLAEKKHEIRRQRHIHKPKHPNQTAKAQKLNAVDRMPVGSTVHCEEDNHTGIVTAINGGTFVVDGHREHKSSDIYPIPSASEYEQIKAEVIAKRIAKKRAEDTSYIDTYERQVHGRGYHRAGTAGGAL